MNKASRYLRFVPSDRLQHFVLMLSFTVLGITGLPQKYADSAISVAMINFMGGIETTRIIHHTTAVVLIMVSVYHVVALGNRIFVERLGLSMLPSFQDVADFIQALKYNLGFSDEPPHYPRFNFIEKMEYWAVVWGTVLMTVTGYVLWNPIVVTNYLPGEVIPAAKVAHGLEALLAVLSIITWHSYFVHLAKFNKSIFNGYLSRDDMAEEHAVELAALRRGVVRRPPSPEVRWRRLRIYAPIATLFVVVMVLGTWRFLTIEQTAITTVPRIAAEERGYQPVPLPPLKRVSTTAATQQEVPRVLPLLEGGPQYITSHGVGEEMARCSLCHDPNGLIAPAPVDHKGRADDTCLTCHQVKEEVGER